MKRTRRGSFVNSDVRVDSIACLERAKQREAAKAARCRMIVCPRCQTAGHVRQMTVSGAKFGTGMLTGGLSLLLSGPTSRKLSTIRKCSNCGSRWVVGL